MVEIINNKNFYPTPPELIKKMMSLIKGFPSKVLEPSAGKGNLVEAMTDAYDYEYRCRRMTKDSISAIEIDPDLQATLRGKGIKLIDSDFLAYSGPDKYDLIIANPPFDEGDKHLLKAIDIMYRGQIIFLLNAETIRNPYSNVRKDLARKLEELGAEIEFIQNAFQDAERKTDVEVALINIIIDRKVEDDLFAGADDTAARAYQTVKDKHEVSTGKTIAELVAEYNRVIDVGTETIVAFYRNYRYVGNYICLNDTDERGKYRSFSSDDLTTMMQNAINSLLVSVRTDFWRRTLDLKDVRSRMTSNKIKEFEHALAARCHMDFTENNIRQFILNLISTYEKTLTDAVVDIFDMFTVRHSFRGGVHEKNIHYYNGWKTNKAFKVGKKVVIPIYAGYGSDGPFRDFEKWKLAWGASDILRDIDTVMNYFDGMKEYYSIAQALNNAFECNPRADRQSDIESTYFKITAHKKGTLHLTFRDDDILRRFNVIACRGKGWLPEDYGDKHYENMSHEERSVVDSFEGEKSYTKKVRTPLFGASVCTQAMIGYNLSEPETCDDDEQMDAATEEQEEPEMTPIEESPMELVVDPSNPAQYSLFA